MNYSLSPQQECAKWSVAGVEVVGDVELIKNIEYQVPRLQVANRA